VQHHLARIAALTALGGLLLLAGTTVSSGAGETPNGEHPFVPVPPPPWNRPAQCFIDKHWGADGSVVAEWICQNAEAQQLHEEKKLPKTPKPPSGPPKVAPPTPASTPSPTPVPPGPQLSPFWLGPP
jgi:hypothetical protein